MTINCPYCRTVNDSAESRCARCGRRLQTGAALTGNQATALALDTNVASRAVAEMPMPPADPNEVQPSLFREAGLQPKVVPIPTLSPLRPASPLERESVRRNAARVAAKTNRPATVGEQQALELTEEKQIRHRPDEALYCDARVALPTHRAVAATVDGFVVLLGTAVFVGLAYYFGVDFTLTKNILMIPVGMLAVVTVLYRGLWCLANSDTPGMRFAGLRLVDFDGRAPKREKRMVRQFAGVLSLASAGVGLLWALADEESLTWHDHISKTFPTTL